MSLIEEGHDKKVRMSNLAIVCSHTVNGVAAIHSDLLKKTIFKDFHELDSKKIQNKTNGVTQRRWIHCCNPGLSQLISDYVGGIDEWITNMEVLKTQLAPQATNPAFISQFAKIKLQNKIKLKTWVKENTGYDISVGALFDIQIKRIHEYKRQLLNLLWCVHRYLEIKATPTEQRKAKFQARVVMIGGKAAPGYARAKVIIHLINSVGAVINNDPEV